MSHGEALQSRKEDPCRDTPWLCEKCDALLGRGFNDDQNNTHLRIAYKKRVLYVVDPKHIQVPCWRCWHINWLHRIPESESNESQS